MLTHCTDQTTRLPAPNILDVSYKYTHSSKTDVTKTWRRFGWAPPDRAKQRAIYSQLNGMN